MFTGGFLREINPVNAYRGRDDEDIVVAGELEVAVFGLAKQVEEMGWILESFDLELEVDILLLDFMELFGHDGNLEAELSDRILLPDIAIEKST